VREIAANAVPMNGSAGGLAQRPILAQKRRGVV
jgi:hypothetical protein